MISSPSPPSVYEYLDYRDYLSCYLEHQKTHNKSFSLRNFSRRANISTGNYLTKVIDRKKNLGPKLTEGFIKALSLGGEDANYFRILTLFGNTNSLDDKMIHLDHLEKIKKKARQKLVTADDQFFRHWYTAIIYELSTCKDTTLTPNLCVQALGGRITPKQASEALDYLIKMGYLTINEKGSFQQQSLSLKSKSLQRSLYIQNNHRHFSRLAQEAIEFPIETRSFQGLFLALNEGQLPQVKQKLEDFTRELLEEFANSPESDTVYRFNLQCFPVAKP